MFVERHCKVKQNNLRFKVQTKTRINKQMHAGLLYISLWLETIVLDNIHATTSFVPDFHGDETKIVYL